MRVVILSDDETDDHVHDFVVCDVDDDSDLLIID